MKQFKIFEIFCYSFVSHKILSAQHKIIAIRFLLAKIYLHFAFCIFRFAFSSPAFLKFRGYISSQNRL